MNDRTFRSEKIETARLSILSNTLLIAMKAASGILMGSISMISEAAHSGVDLLASLIAYFSVRESGKPADRDHPFGHGKIENISGTAEAVLIFGAAAWIIYEAVMRLRRPAPLESIGWGVLVMLVSCLVNLAVSRRLFAVGEKTDSLALTADAWHLMTDVYTSAGVMGGLILIWAGEKMLPGIHLHWIDPVAALMVSVLILKAAWGLTVKSARDLMDTTLPAQEMDTIRSLITGKYPQVNGFHKLKTRKSGSVRFVEFHMLVSPDMTVEQSHSITDELTREINSLLPDSVITIHVEPCDGRCDDECEANCLVPPERRLVHAGDKSWPAA
jgi:cation diffusion facilitator family transporter